MIPGDGAPEALDSNIVITEAHAPIDDVRGSIPTGKTDAPAAPPIALTTAQKLSAQKVVIKQALKVMNIPVIYGTGYLTEQRVTTEAAFSDAEMEALATAWAPFIEVQNPLTVALVTTFGIIGNKSVEIMRLNAQRKAPQEYIEEVTPDAAVTPESRSDGDRITGGKPIGA